MQIGIFGICASRFPLDTDLHKLAALCPYMQSHFIPLAAVLLHQNQSYTLETENQLFCELLRPGFVLLPYKLLPVAQCLSFSARYQNPFHSGHNFSTGI